MLFVIHPASLLTAITVEIGMRCVSNDWPQEQSVGHEGNANGVIDREEGDGKEVVGCMYDEMEEVEVATDAGGKRIRTTSVAFRVPLRQLSFSQYFPLSFYPFLLLIISFHPPLPPFFHLSHFPSLPSSFLISFIKSFFLLSSILSFVSSSLFSSSLYFRPSLHQSFSAFQSCFPLFSLHPSLHASLPPSFFTSCFYNSFPPSSILSCLSSSICPVVSPSLLLSLPPSILLLLSFFMFSLLPSLPLSSLLP